MSKNIAILHYGYLPNIGGVEILISEHADILSQMGYNVYLFVGEGKNENPKIHLKTIPELKARVPVTQEAIYERLKENLMNMDVVIVHNMLTVYPNLEFIKAFRKFVERYPKKKYIAWVHDHNYITNERIKTKEEVNNQEEYSLMTTPVKNTTYVFISKSIEESFTSMVNMLPHKIKVIRNGVNLHKFLQLDDKMWRFIKKNKLFERRPILLTPANIKPRKNIEYMLNVVSNLKKHYPKILYILTGRIDPYSKTKAFYLKVIEDKIKNLDLENNVILLGKTFTQALTYQQIHNLYEISDVVLYISKRENFGIPIIESALTKNLIILSNIRSLQEIGGKYFPTINFQNTTTEEVASLIYKKLIDNKTLQAKWDFSIRYNLEKIISENLIPLFE